VSAPRPWLTPPPFPLASLRRWLVVLTLVTPVGACSDVAPSPAPTPRVAIDAARPRTPYWTDWLARYVAVDTTVPPGHEADALPILTEALTELGLSPTSTTWGDRRANVWATLEAPAATRRGGALILLHHIDVVPTERARWTTDPLGAARKDGRLYGRGTQDMKVFAALHLAALEHLVAERSRLTRDVIFLAVSDEEVSGEGARRFVDHVLPTLRAEYLLDEGGFALHEFLPGHDVVVIATAQKRAAKLRLVASGRAGHGSRPIAGSGPEVLMTALARVQASPAPMRLEPYNAPLFAALAQLTPWPRSALLARLDWPGMLWALEGRLARDESLAPVLRDTAAITVVSAGEKVNVIPSTATAVLDVRLLPDTPAARVRGAPARAAGRPAGGDPDRGGAAGRHRPLAHRRRALPRAGGGRDRAPPQRHRGAVADGRRQRRAVLSPARPQGLRLRARVHGARRHRRDPRPRRERVAGCARPGHAHVHGGARPLPARAPLTRTLETSGRAVNLMRRGALTAANPSLAGSATAARNLRTLHAGRRRPRSLHGPAQRSAQ
jgi:acetylornithine deacetylase/succinyl-diaminopimelate desuccinylase-like protein